MATLVKKPIIVELFKIKLPGTRENNSAKTNNNF